MIWDMEIWLPMGIQALLHLIWMIWSIPGLNSQDIIRRRLYVLRQEGAVSQEDTHIDML